MDKFLESIINKEYMTAEKEFQREISERVNSAIDSIKKEISENLLESVSKKPFNNSYKLYYSDPSGREYTSVIQANSHGHAKKILYKLSGSDLKVTDSKQLDEQEALKEAKKLPMEERDDNDNGVADEEEQLDENIKLDHREYFNSHGKTAKGKGSWFLSKHKSIDFKKHKEGEDYYQSKGGVETLSSAAKNASKVLNTKQLYVMP